MDKDISFFTTFINGKVVYQFQNDKYRLYAPQLRSIKYKDKMRAKIWFSWVADTAEFIQDEEIRGLTFRSKGICVGDSTLFSNNCMPPGRESLANWFTGEIFLLDDDIKPSAARDRFEEGSNLTEFYAELKRAVGKELSFISDIRSEISGATQDLERLKTAKKQGKRISVEIYKKIDKRIKDLTRHQSKDKYGFDFEIINLLRNALRQQEKEDEERIRETEKEEYARYKGAIQQKKQSTSCWS